MQPQPDRRSVIIFSTLLTAAVAFAIISLIATPHFFAGEFRGSYHYWLITSRLVVWVGVAMFVPALIFFRLRRFAFAVLMLIHMLVLILLGNEGAMQFRLGWDAGETRYYIVSDHLYLPPFDTQLQVYVIECNARDLGCVSTPLATISHASWIEPDLDPDNGYHLMLCHRNEPEYSCEEAYDFPAGAPIYPVAPPD